ncbi:MAG: ABC transporter ATP-binding protein [Thermoflexibacter sp.]|nr:ABC transporter ATP-binding protein [Thermoflexibacter sp.]
MKKIEVSNLYKSYNKNIVLQNFSINLYSGAIYGLLGKNGAGKSTLIHLLINYILPSQGEILFDGLSYSLENEVEIKKKVGVVLSVNTLIEELTINQYLHFYGSLYDITKTEKTQRILSMVDTFFDNTDILDEQISNLSMGMKKKVMLCSALLHKPEFLILDEPFTNLDYATCLLFIDILKFYISTDRIIIVSSHELDLIEKLVSDIILIDEKTVKYAGAIETFKENMSLSLGDFMSHEYLSISNNKIHSNLQWLKTTI